MTPAQRRLAFDRFLSALAKQRASRLGLAYAGTLSKLPPPPLPGGKSGATRYYLNAVARDGSGGRLVELTGPALRRAERWVETEQGPKPAL